MLPSSHDPRQSCRPESLYEIVWESAVYDWRKALVEFKVQSKNEGYYQNGKEIDHVNATELYHTTRDAFLAKILMTGLKTTGLSHGKVIIWARSELSQANFNWGITPADAIGGVVMSRGLASPRGPGRGFKKISCKGES